MALPDVEKVNSWALATLRVLLKRVDELERLSKPLAPQRISLFRALCLDGHEALGSIVVEVPKVMDQTVVIPAWTVVPSSAVQDFEIPEIHVVQRQYENLEKTGGSLHVKSPSDPECITQQLQQLNHYAETIGDVAQVASTLSDPSHLSAYASVEPLAADPSVDEFKEPIFEQFDDMESELPTCLRKEESISIHQVNIKKLAMCFLLDRPCPQQNMKRYTFRSLELPVELPRVCGDCDDARDTGGGVVRQDGYFWYILPPDKRHFDPVIVNFREFGILHHDFAEGLKAQRPSIPDYVLADFAFSSLFDIWNEIRGVLGSRDEAAYGEKHAVILESLIKIRVPALDEMLEQGELDAS
jgi:hypothetical protein